MWNLLELFVCLAIITTASRGEPLTGDVSAPLSDKKFPFVVSIAKIFDNTPDNPLGHVCGGALIARRYVLTAASCFDVGANKDNYFVYAGNTDLVNCGAFAIKDVIKFDDYFKMKLCKRTPVDRSYKENDIAVVEMEERLRCPVYKAKVWNIAPQLLPLALAARNLTIQTAGWTKFLDGPAPRYMLRSDLRLVNRDECLTQIRNSWNNPYYWHDENLFCTVGVGGFYTVLDAGDKGSPVFVEYEPDKYLVIGVNLKSVPETDDVTRYPDQGNTHISVNSYIGFIKSIARIPYL